MSLYVQRLAGLGNQLFVAAAGHYYAEKHAMELKILYPKDLNRHSKQEYSLSILKKFRHFQSAGPDVVEIREKENCGAELQIPKDRDVKLLGYFQRGSYVTDTFCNLLSLPSPSLWPAKEQFSLVLHLRGGDYLFPPWRTWHLIDVQDYIKRAKDKFPELFTGLVLVFTNDPRYSLDVMREANLQYQMVLAPNDVSELQSLADMAAGDVPLMISNSSFSWWAARLSQKERLKLLPRDWFPSEEKSRSWDCVNEIVGGIVV
jgi:hypothetical protein